MTAAAITSDFLCKNECPIQGHTFLPNNKNGIMLFHIMMLSMKTAWKRESVNLSSMGKRKVSTFLANEEKKRLPKSGKDKQRSNSPKRTPSFLKNVGTFEAKRRGVFLKTLGYRKLLPFMAIRPLFTNIRFHFCGTRTMKACNIRLLLCFCLYFFFCSLWRLRLLEENTFSQYLFYIHIIQILSVLHFLPKQIP